MNDKKTILVAPLNWGLGHATRCIPIIWALQGDGYHVIIGSDGEALALLKKEFPETKTILLPSYNISYPKKGNRLKNKLIASSPGILRAIKAEHAVLDNLIEQYTIGGVISDNRLGLYTKRVPTVFITHQLTVLSGKTTWLSTYLHNRFIKKFNECWVPDHSGDNNLSGLMGHPKKETISTKHIGPLSRLRSSKKAIKQSLVAILSGPEPQRTYLEEILLIELKKYEGSVLLIRGVVEEVQRVSTKDNITIINYATSKELEEAISASEFVIARSGYTTIMDLACLEKKAFFIPTPGQTEQEYLAKRLKEKEVAPYSVQEYFNVNDLAKVYAYKGFKKQDQEIDLKELFSLFERKGKL